MSEPRHEKCKFVLLALVVPSSELQDLPSFTTGAGFVATNVAHFDRHLTEKQQKKLQPALVIIFCSLIVLLKVQAQFLSPSVPQAGFRHHHRHICHMGTVSAPDLPGLPSHPVEVQLPHSLHVPTHTRGLGITTSFLQGLT